MAEATFEVFSASAVDVHQFADVQCESLKDAYFELRCAGAMADDFAAIWPNGPREAPDWDFAQAKGDAVRDAVIRVEVVSQLMKFAFRELEFRARPN
jgi:hypothetical protein